jgi:hypothetical protein
MSQIWTPPDVVQELRDATATHNRLLLEVMDFDVPGMGSLRRELEGFDALLRLGKASMRAELPGVRPGFWHVLRLNTMGPYYCEPLTDVDGEYAEPSLSMFDALRMADLQSPQVVRAREAEDARRRAEKAAADAREDEERQAEIVERWKAVSETSVSMSRDTPWTQGVAGRRGRK